MDNRRGLVALAAVALAMGWAGAPSAAVLGAPFGAEVGVDVSAEVSADMVSADVDAHVANNQDQGLQMSAQVWLPIGFANDHFGPPPVPVVVTVRPTATATLLATGTPTALPTPPPTPTVTPRSGYSEPLTARPSLDDLKNSYSAARWYETMLEVLRRRYSTGHHIVISLEDSKSNAAIWTNGRTGTFMDLIGALDLAVHEMNHQLGFQEGFIPTIGKVYFYEVRADLTVKVDVVPTYARSEIAQFIKGPLENQYKNTYLTGQSGEQGFFNLLDEFNAYTHSLFTGYGVHDLSSPGRRISHRDGLVTFMLYTELYLRQARTKHAADYAAMRGNPEVQALVKLLWDRANFILDTTEAIPGLALNAAAVEAEMRKAELWGEIERFVGP